MERYVFPSDADERAFLCLRGVRMAEHPFIPHPEQSVLTGKRRIDCVERGVRPLCQHDEAVEAAVVYAAGGEMQHTRIYLHRRIRRQIKPDNAATVKTAVDNILRQGKQQNKPCRCEIDLAAPMIFLGVERKATAVAVARLNRAYRRKRTSLSAPFQAAPERIIGGRIAITVFGNGEGAHSVRQRGNIAEVKHLTVRGKFRVKHAVQRQTGIFFRQENREPCSHQTSKLKEFFHHEKPRGGIFKRLVISAFFNRNIVSGIYAFAHLGHELREIVRILKHAAVQYELAGVKRVYNAFERSGKGGYGRLHELCDLFVAVLRGAENVVYRERGCIAPLAYVPQHWSFFKREHGARPVKDSGGGGDCLQTAAFAAGAGLAAALYDRNMADLGALLAAAAPYAAVYRQRRADAVFTAQEELRAEVIVSGLEHLGGEQRADVVGHHARQPSKRLEAVAYREILCVQRAEAVPHDAPGPAR